MPEKRLDRHLLTEGPIGRQILLLSVPLILGNLLQEMYNTVDAFIVGNYLGNYALASVSAGTPLINLIIAFSQGSAIGAGVIISQHLGAEDHEQVHISVHTSMTISVLVGVTLSVAGAFLGRQFLVWMRTPSEILEDSALYLRIYMLGLLFNVVYNMATGILNAAGNVRKSLQYLATASVTNVILDIILIEMLGMGVEGAAIATDISQGLSCFLVLRYLMKTREIYRIIWKKLHIQKEMAGRIIRMGLPSGIQNMMTAFSNVIIQSGVNDFGPDAVAGFGAYLKYDGIFSLPVRSFALALTTFTGQNYGAGKRERIRKGTKYTLTASFIYTMSAGVFFLLFGEKLLGYFTDSPEAIAYGMLAIHRMCPFYFMLGIMNELAGLVRGTGRTLPPMIILMSVMCVFRIIWVETVIYLHQPIDKIFMVYPICWLLGTILMTGYVWKKRILSLQNITIE